MPWCMYKALAKRTRKSTQVNASLQIKPELAYGLAKGGQTSSQVECKSTQVGGQTTAQVERKSKTIDSLA